jgi:drug/metabolite transporter (DMT)-like permease
MSDTPNQGSASADGRIDQFRSDIDDLKIAGSGQGEQRLLVVGIVLMVAGVALAIGSPVGSIDILGVVLTLLFACIVAGYFLVAEEGLEGVDPLAWLGITVLAAALFLVPGGLLLGGHHTPDATGWLALLGVALVSSITACLFQTMGLMRLGSAATTLVASVEIATVVILSYLVLGERPGIISIIGAVLVIVGAALAPIAVKRKVDTGGSSVKPGAVA